MTEFWRYPNIASKIHLCIWPVHPVADEDATEVVRHQCDQHITADIQTKPHFRTNNQFLSLYPVIFMGELMKG